MILLVPAKPEVPKRLAPRLWPGLVLMLIVSLCYLFTFDLIKEDNAYIEGVRKITPTTSDGTVKITTEIETLLSLRPILRLTPANGDWDFRRLFLANFLHGSTPHLLFNLIGIFAGARICFTFFSYRHILLIFVLGGSMGLWTSLSFSRAISQYIPHLGASAGIFALMGAFYVYNFRFRTKYFFWNLGSHRMIPLKTSWFFFLDVILMELILSSAQLFPSQFDSVDHFAHVVGFAMGGITALALRALQRWPEFIHTRAEWLYWRKLSPNPESSQQRYEALLKMLHLNPYNDRIKMRFYELFQKNIATLSDNAIDIAYLFVSPTFIRLHPEDVAHTVEATMGARRALPKSWLARTPYDLIIKVAYAIARDTQGPRGERRKQLLEDFIRSYQKAQAPGFKDCPKLELLLQKLEGINTPS